MNNKIKRYISGAIGFLLVFFLMATVIPAQDTDEMKEQKSEGREEVSEAAKVFREIMDEPDKAIPRELLENATGIGIFPGVKKAAFLIGGRYGDGIVMRRMADGTWSAPVFYDLGGASFGAQIGAKSTDYIMLFMNEGALRELEDDKLEFGGDLSFAAGPIGRTAGAGTNLTLDAGILTWSQSDGAFIGASLKGAALTADNSINKAFYNMEGGKVLNNPGMVNLSPMPGEFQSLKQLLTNYGGKSTKNPTAATTNTSNSTNSNYTNSNMNRFVSYDGADDPANRNNMTNDMRNTQDLARRVRSELLTLPYYSVFDWIEFDVSPTGVVTLRGQVTTPPDTKSRAEAYVEDVRGVSQVVNNIEVLPVSPNDERLREQLYREIYSGPLFRYQVGSLQSIHIIVKNGRATLKGVVDSEADKNLAGIRAKTVSGVFEVNNDLAVRSERP